MSYGLQVSNTSNRIQIDQDFRNARQIATGSLGAGEHYVPLPYPLNNEPPIVLLRPHGYGYYIGAVALWNDADIVIPGSSSPNGWLNVGAQGGFDYAICASTQGTPYQESDAWGLQVFSADGVTAAYDSRQKHPNITQLLFKPADTSSGGGYPNTYGISGFSDMPWFLGNPLIKTFVGVGEFSESVGCVMGCVNSLSSVTMDFRDANPSTNYPAFPGLTDRSSYNPYYGTNTWFGVAKFA